MGPNSIHIQARRDNDKQWLTTRYKLIDEEIDMLVDDWPAKWRIPVNNEELSETGVGPPPDTPIDQMQA